MTRAWSIGWGSFAMENRMDEQGKCKLTMFSLIGSRARLFHRRVWVGFAFARAHTNSMELDLLGTHGCDHTYA